MVFSIGRNRRSRKSIVSKLPFVKFLGPLVSAGAIVIGMFMMLTGRIDLSSLDVFRGSTAVESGQPTLSPVKLELGQKSPQSIRIATFHITDFDPKKAANSDVMGVLARVIAQFDVVAIQEVQGGDSEPIRALVDLLRRSNASYAATVSAPIGQAPQAESYAYLWDDTRIRLVPNSAYLVQDPADRMRREPMIASFETRVGTADGRRPFRFTLINAHASPPNAGASLNAGAPLNAGASPNAGVSSNNGVSSLGNELNVLDDVFVRVRQYDYQSTGEEDCILLGDLHVGVEGLGELGQIPAVQSVAGLFAPQTSNSAMHDHIVLDREQTREFNGRYGKIDFVEDLGLTAEQASEVSDHQPLWAEFSVYETPDLGAIANGAELIR